MHQKTPRNAGSFDMLVANYIVEQSLRSTSMMRLYQSDF